MLVLEELNPGYGCICLFSFNYRNSNLDQYKLGLFLKFFCSCYLCVLVTLKKPKMPQTNLYQTLLTKRP